MRCVHTHEVARMLLAREAECSEFARMRAAARGDIVGSGGATITSCIEKKE